MSLIPNLKKIDDKSIQGTDSRDPKKDLEKMKNGINAMSENMATADITTVYIIDKLKKGEELDIEEMKTLAGQLGEIYEIVNDLLDIVEEYVPPEEDEAWPY